MIRVTLDCVILTQFSVIKNIHCNVGLKCFFSIVPKWEFWKSVNNWQRYRQMKVLHFLWTMVYMSSWSYLFLVHVTYLSAQQQHLIASSVSLVSGAEICSFMTDTTCKFPTEFWQKVTNFWQTELRVLKILILRLCFTPNGFFSPKLSIFGRECFWQDTRRFFASFLTSKNLQVGNSPPLCLSDWAPLFSASLMLYIRQLVCLCAVIMPFMDTSVRG